MPAAAHAAASAATLRSGSAAIKTIGKNDVYDDSLRTAAMANALARAARPGEAAAAAKAAARSASMTAPSVRKASASS